ncbi:UBX domain-containing protein 1 [Bacidia gigantensis]|uniref:UBX domain-containing protein 1 n=1 Tax=Bacidia gigantensis TaxID=2732470 RepID=UPI001D03D44F|nr:UBX domain-containing protein 1 [Bacidia gigantensis]KAG8529752.1 UBX domain-containing protein 1 [Bacidia gigantensis]
MFATLNDLNAVAAGGHAGHSHEDDDEDDDDGGNPNMFAGGEKSGLAVQNPDDLKKKILDRARRGLQRPGGDDPRQAESNFRGAARTLGGDDAPSQEIPDPNAAAPRRPELVQRRLHFWADGFSVDDGPLYRFDDPKNAQILAQIKLGRAPTHILNVTHDQEVDVHLEQHKEKYVQPKKKFKPFEGGGQRLGSPSPADRETVTETAVQPQQQTQAAKPPSTGSEQPSVDVNESEPTISLQIRLGDGTRMASRFNNTHTIGDVYSFVDAASPQSRTRSYTLMTTFPSKELGDKSQVLGDLSEFKRGGVMVQKWT